MKRQKFLAVATVFPLTLFMVLGIYVSTVSAAPVESVLYRFKGGTDGEISLASLVEDQAHNLYGTTFAGGASGLGTVFEISRPETTWTETVLYSFAGGNDGSFPSSSLIFDKAGNLYGTTYAGGGSANCGGTPGGCGTVFQLTPPATQGAPWTETVLYNFTGLADGANPAGGLLMDRDGNLYGTTYNGGGVVCGTGTCGTAFELTPPAVQGGAWTETVLHAFGKGNDGIHPAVGLTFGVHGGIFGTTQGGTSTAGVVFKLKPPVSQGGAWTEGVIYRFTGGADGGSPNGLIIDKTGNLYGTTSAGGQSYGLVFELSPTSGGAWTQSVLYTFTNGSDGAQSYANLLFDKQGNLYGTTSAGGLNNNGSVFELTPPAVLGGPWTETTVYDFKGGHDGQTPYSGLTFGYRGQLYGTTSLGGGPKAGTVFRIFH